MLKLLILLTSVCLVSCTVFAFDRCADILSLSSKIEYREIQFTVPILSKNGFELAARPLQLTNRIRTSEVAKTIDKVWDLSNFKTSRLPEEVAEVTDRSAFSRKGVTRVLDVPIKFPRTNYRVPQELIQFKEVIQKVIDVEHALNSNIDEYFAYLTVDQGLIEPGRSQRRPGAHVDGFQGSEIPVKTEIDHSYIVSDVLPTVFYDQVFATDHLDERLHNFFWEFDRQSDEAHAFRPKPYGVFLADAYAVHRADIATEPTFRTFVRITFSKQAFNRKGLTDNPLFDYHWDRPEKGIPPNLIRYTPN